MMSTDVQYCFVFPSSPKTHSALCAAKFSSALVATLRSAHAISRPPPTRDSLSSPAPPGHRRTSPTWQPRPPRPRTPSAEGLSSLFPFALASLLCPRICWNESNTWNMILDFSWKVYSAGLWELERTGSDLRDVPISDALGASATGSRFAGFHTSVSES